MAIKTFEVTVTTDSRGRVMVPVPFDPDLAWGTKAEHRVAGTVNGMGVRAMIEPLGSGWGFVLGPAWRRDCGISPDERVEVALFPEGPQREDLAPDLAAALAAHPQAGAFFDSLAQFYRRAYLRWIDATKRRPEERARRIAEVVGLLAGGIKERP
ncbi:MAG: YdeI/OmpD-associated family protein [Actinomycetota bacterium]